MTRFDLSTVEFFRYDSLVTNHEMQLYSILTENLNKYYPNQYIICPKVRIGDIIRMTNRTFDKLIRRRYQSRHFDFVICSKDTLKPILAIELQDNSHKNKYWRYVDALKRELCTNAGLLLLQLWTTNALDIKKLLYHWLKNKEIAI